ncbi:hypothetical protein ASF62_13950 [Leifsonia sp. Leaf325]|nr:hypothetical protein [Leifsonia sp. Leaf325]KQQ92897.1 hypothetical protein ASF62_13950 [Leifsonia sp. Leaf325]
MTNLSDVKRIIASEGLTKYRLFNAEQHRPSEVGIRRVDGGFLVFSIDEREASVSERVYADESAAYDDFLRRLRAGARLDARRQERRAQKGATRSGDGAIGLTAGIVAYTGHGAARTPTADTEAVLALVPDSAGETLLAEVRRVIAASDTIEAAWSEAIDDSLYPVFAQRLLLLEPALDERALHALSWRWGYLRTF